MMNNSRLSNFCFDCHTTMSKSVGNVSLPALRLNVSQTLVQRYFLAAAHREADAGDGTGPGSNFLTTTRPALNVRQSAHRSRRAVRLSLSKQGAGFTSPPPVASLHVLIGGGGGGKWMVGSLAA